MEKMESNGSYDQYLYLLWLSWLSSFFVTLNEIAVISPLHDSNL